MKNKMIKISTKISTALVVAASVMTMASITAFAADDTVIADETVAIEEVAATEEAPECEMTVPETEGQGDIIDDEFAVNEVDAWIASCKDRPTGVTQYVRTVVDTVVIAEEANGAEEAEEVEGQGDVIDDEFAYVEGQGDVIDDQFAVAPEAEVQPATESLILIEAPVIDVIMNEVEGQGDVIDDEFAYVEGQGDVIDDEFAYVEGQGDVIDDQFAVTPEAEAAVEAVEVAENDTEVVVPSVNSFVAVGSVDLVEANIFEPTEDDEEIKKAYDATNVDEKDKSPFTKAMETFNKETNLFKDYEDMICKKIDKDNTIGVPEKELKKELAKTGLGTINGIITGEIVDGAGAVRKGTKAIECFSKAFDSKTTEGAVLNTLEGVKNGLEGVVSAFPGGGLVVSTVETAGSLLKYGAVKLVSWLF